MRRSLLLILSIALVAGLAASPAAAESASVYIYDPDGEGPPFGFSPDTVTVDNGEMVTWWWYEGVHRVRDREIDFGLIDSGPAQGPETQHALTFDAAGTYLYLCQRHPTTMLGKVRVRMTFVGFRTGGSRVRWASAAPREGWVYDVQHRIPGGDWEIWKRGTSDLAGTHPISGAPENADDFRARAREAGSGMATGYSPVLRVSTGMAG